MRAWAIVVAAGSGARLGASIPKAFVPVAGEPMVAHTLRALRASRRVEGVVVVTPDGYEDRIAPLAATVAAGLRVVSVAGGATRSASVREGLRVVEAVGEGAEIVVVHDAARPLVRAEDIDRTIDAVEHAPAAVLALPVADTLKSLDDDGTVTTVSREGLFRALTPQAFRTDVLVAAHEGAPDATDDAALVEAMGVQVVLVPASAESPKVTGPADLALPSRMLGAARTGIGFDAHAFADGVPLILGGVEIDAPRGLAGHSDADVLTHAIVDAVLGAAALGDIGMHFPSSDARWAGADSLAFARAAAEMVREAGWDIGAIDATLILEAPPVAPYRTAMAAAVGKALQIPAERVSIKATTTDGLGATGRGEGAAAFAVATLLAATP